MKTQAARLASAGAAIVLLCITTGQVALAQMTVHDLQAQWAVVNYQTENKAQLEAFDKLIAAAEDYTGTHPDDADGWVWSGIIKSSFAGAKGGLGALGLAKAARRDLEKALEIDDRAMNGSAYTTLGTLYLNVPGWPIGFGSDKKAEAMLRKGLEIDPDGIDSNYFFAEFLRAQGEIDQAKIYYGKASQAAPRPGRPLADQGRHEEINAALAALDAT